MATFAYLRCRSSRRPPIPVLLAGLVDSGVERLQPRRCDAQDGDISPGSLALTCAAGQGMITLGGVPRSDRGLRLRKLYRRRSGPKLLGGYRRHRLNAAIHRAAEFQITGNLPDLEQRFEGPYSVRPARSSRGAAGIDAAARTVRRCLVRASEAETKPQLTASSANSPSAWRAADHLVGARLALSLKLTGLRPRFVDSWCALILANE